jgi:ubiquinone/menaquinone biosynthesis C-methylase UbiE
VQNSQPAAIVIRFRVPGGERLGDLFINTFTTMDQPQAKSLIQNAVTGDRPQRWADLGCGAGTFTLALNSILPAGSHLTAVDKQAQNLSVDFIKAGFEKDKLPLSGPDGILLANSIHYVRGKQQLIKKLEPLFADGPVFLIVEYDTTRFSPRVPYLINYQKLQRLFTELGYRSITKLTELPSRFGGSMYSALIRL